MLKDKIALNIKLKKKEKKLLIVLRVELLEVTYFENILLTDLFPEYGYIKLIDLKISDMDLFRVFYHYILEHSDSGRDGFSSMYDVIMNVIRYKKSVKINGKIYQYEDIEQLF